MRTETGSAQHQQRSLLLAKDAEDLLGQRSRHELDRIKEYVAVDLGLGAGAAVDGEVGLIESQRNAAPDAGRLIEHRGDERENPVRNLVVDDGVEQSGRRSQMHPALALLIGDDFRLKVKAAAVERRVDGIDVSLAVLEADNRRGPPSLIPKISTCSRLAPSSPLIPASNSFAPDFGSVPASRQARGEPEIDAWGSIFLREQV